MLWWDPVVFRLCSELRLAFRLSGLCTQRVREASTPYIWYFRPGRSEASRQSTKDHKACRSTRLHICWYLPHLDDLRR